MTLCTYTKAPSAPTTRDQASLVLACYAQRLSRALAARNGMTDPARLMQTDRQIEVSAQHLRTSVETCRGLKVRQGILDWTPGQNVTLLLEAAGSR